MKRIIALAAAAAMTLLALTGCQGMEYDEAVKLYQEGKYTEAAAMFTELGDYEDSAEYVEKCNQEIMLQTYGREIALLNQDEWYFNGGSDTKLNRISFSDGNATVSKVYFDGNGKHEEADYTASFVIDDDSVTIKIDGSTEVDIPYSLEGDSITLGAGEYLTSEQVEEGLQGYWRLRFTDTTLGTPLEHERNWYINNGMITYQDANEGLNLSKGQYYYSDPETCSYTLSFGGFTVSSGDTGFHFAHYNIINGEVVLLHFDRVADRASSMPNAADGYEF